MKAACSRQVPEEVFLLFFELFEFFEKKGNRLPIDLSILASIATKASCYAKALRYKELEFLESPSSQYIEPLIILYSLVSLHDSADGVLSLAEHYEFPLQENWFEKLQKWDDALLIYESNISNVYSTGVWNTNAALINIAHVGDEFMETIGSFLQILDSSYPLTSFSTFNFEEQHHEPLLSLRPANIQPKLSLTSQRYLFDLLFDYSMHHHDDIFESVPFFNDIFGVLRCLKNTYDWERLIVIGRLLWFKTPIRDSSTFSLTNFRKILAPFVAISSWGINRYDILAKVLPYISRENFFSSFLSAITAVSLKDWTTYDIAIESAKIFLDGETSPLVFEEYTKSLSAIVKSQLITELEDIAEFFSNNLGYRHLSDPNRLERVWSTRLYNGFSSLEHMYQLLKIQSIISEVLPTNIKHWICFANTCRKNGSILLSIRTLEFLFLKFFKIDINLLELCFSSDANSSIPLISGLFESIYNNSGLFHLVLNLSKILKDLQKHDLAMAVLSKLISFIITVLSPNCACNGISGTGFLVCTHIMKLTEQSGSIVTSKHSDAAGDVESLNSKFQQLTTKETTQPCKGGDSVKLDNPHAFLSKLLVLYSKWKKAIGTSSVMVINTTNLYTERNLFSTERNFPIDIITLQRLSIQLDGDSYKSWYFWALSNFEIINQNDTIKISPRALGSNIQRLYPLAKNSKTSDGETSSSLIDLIVSAITGLIKAISLKSKSSIQDLLRILTLLFKYGSYPSVQTSFLKGCSILPIDVWLQVIPQVLIVYF